MVRTEAAYYFKAEFYNTICRDSETSYMYLFKHELLKILSLMYRNYLIGYCIVEKKGLFN